MGPSRSSRSASTGRSRGSSSSRSVSARVRSSTGWRRACCGLTIEASTRSGTARSHAKAGGWPRGFTRATAPQAIKAGHHCPLRGATRRRGHRRAGHSGHHAGKNAARSRARPTQSRSGADDRSSAAEQPRGTDRALSAQGGRAGGNDSGRAAAPGGERRHRGLRGRLRMAGAPRHRGARHLRDPRVARRIRARPQARPQARDSRVAGRSRDCLSRLLAATEARSPRRRAAA